jgi:LDH2 family malate/lactate/ureidoglycolate dehydrogenase
MPNKFTVEELHAIVYKIFHKAGCKPTDSDSIAEVLIAAELRGIPSHGIVRIKDYIGLYQKGRMNMQPDIKIVHESPSTALIDGDNGPGIVVAKEAMKTAIAKASSAGTGWVAVRNSNHFGIAGFYSLMAAEKDMIGIASTNANALVAPTFSTDRLLGTNPIAFAIPGKEEKPFVADFATTPIARGKLEIMEKQGKSAPEGFIQDETGKSSTDPSILKRGGAILPLGGDYEHASYKGYCMGAMVDILSAVLPGANFGPFVPPQVAYLEPKSESPGKGLGHFFGAMRLDAFRPAEEVKTYLDHWIRTFRNANSIDEKNKVRIPGEPEYEKEEKIRESGIEIIPQVWEELLKTAHSLDLKL